MSTKEFAVKPLNLTDVRDRISTVFSEAVQHHRPIPIARGNRELGMILGLEEIGRLVEGLSFHPEVFKEEHGVSIWLPEFQIFGSGRDLPSAREDLLEEVREYVSEYVEDIDAFRSAPNRRAHFPHIVRALVADLAKKLEPVIFDDRASMRAGQASAAADVR
jgi:antitoxin YefM